MKKSIILFLSAMLLITGGVLNHSTIERSAAAYTMETENEPLSTHAEETDTSSSETEEAANTDSPIGIDETPEDEGTNQVSEKVRNYPEETEEETEELPKQNDSIYQEPMIPSSALLPNEAIVRNYSELKSVLENDNGITVVYFGDNITMQTTGIKINSNKAKIIIDGFNPLDPDQTQPYTLTDYNSGVFTDTIYINSEGIKSLHVRDLTIIGKNYYGPFGVYDLSSLSGTVIIYERVNYNGPQLGYHRSGTIKLIDCTVRIHGNNGICENQEFSEAKHLLFQGKNIINTVTSGYSVFWIPIGGTFTIADDSSLVLISPNTSVTYGVFYADGYTYKVDISIGKHAVFDATISGIVAPDTFVTLNSLTVQEGGTFRLSATKATTGPILKMGGSLTVEKNAKFIISGYGSAAYAVLRQENGDITVGKDAIFQITADNPYMTLINLVGRAFICNDPASILLYNANRDILASASAGRVYVNAQQINYWNKTSMGDLDNPPLYKWEKEDKTNFLIDAALAIGASGNFTSLSSNHTPNDSHGIAPSATTFNMVDARVLAFGSLDLFVAEPTTKSKSIVGITAPTATVRVSFTQEGIEYILPDVTADSAGNFHVPLSIALHESTVVKVKSNWQYLTTEAKTIVKAEGTLEFFVPDFMEYLMTDISSSTQIVNRLQDNWEIIVSDTRSEGGRWRIYACVNNEMTPDSANHPVLDSSLVYVDNDGNKTVMSKGIETLIAEHITTADEDIFTIVWDNDKGILLEVKPGNAFVNTIYKATISWTLIDGP